MGHGVGDSQGFERRESNPATDPLPFAAEAASLAALVLFAPMILPSPSPAHPLCSRLALDLRSLALLRAGLGIVLFCNAIGRLLQAGALYTDAGLLPRDLAVGAIEAGRISVHLASGGLLFALLLSALQAGAAALLALGWRSRASGLALWLLMVSAIARHPAMLDASEAFALALLSFGLLLPWNARWSVDAAFASTRPGPVHLSWAGIALLVYVCLLPIALLLWADAPGGLSAWLSAPAAHAPGRWLLHAAALIGPLNVALHIAGWLILPLALAPWSRPYARRAALVLAMLLGAGALLSLCPATLAVLTLLATALLIDGALWDRLSGDASLPELRIHPDRDVAGAVGFALLAREFLCLPRTQVIAAQDNPRAARLLTNGVWLVVIDRNEEAYLDATAVATLLRRTPWLRPLRRFLGGGLASAFGALLLRLRSLARCGLCVGASPTDTARFSSAPVTVTAGLLFVFATLVQLGAAGALPSLITSGARAVLRPFALDRAWIDLLPAAEPGMRWIAVPGEKLDGGEVDALSSRLSPPDYAPSSSSHFEGERGRRYERVLAQPASTFERTAFARFLCQQHPDELARVRVTLMVREHEADAPEQQVLLRHECGSAQAP